jgi:hypothetical protein
MSEHELKFSGVMSGVQIHKGYSASSSKSNHPGTDHVNRFTDRIKQMQKYHGFFFGEGRNKAVLMQLAS